MKPDNRRKIRKSMKKIMKWHRKLWQRQFGYFTTKECNLRLECLSLRFFQKNPDKTIVNQDGVTFEHNYRSNDHAPAHAHVKGNGPNTRIDRLGNPIDNTDLPMSKAQRKVYKSNRSKINRKLRKIGKWLRFK